MCPGGYGHDRNGRRPRLFEKSSTGPAVGLEAQGSTIPPTAAVGASTGERRAHGTSPGGGRGCREDESRREAELAQTGGSARRWRSCVGFTVYSRIERWGSTGRSSAAESMRLESKPSTASIPRQFAVRQLAPLERGGSTSCHPWRHVGEVSAAAIATGTHSEAVRAFMAASGPIPEVGCEGPCIGGNDPAGHFLQGTHIAQMSSRVVVAALMRHLGTPAVPEMTVPAEGPVGPMSGPSSRPAEDSMAVAEAPGRAVARPVVVRVVGARYPADMGRAPVPEDRCGGIDGTRVPTQPQPGARSNRRNGRSPNPRARWRPR